MPAQNLRGWHGLVARSLFYRRRLNRARHEHRSCWMLRRAKEGGSYRVRDLLTDYRVLIVGVDNERIKEWIEKRLLVATDTGLTTDARSLAAQIGLLEAIKETTFTANANIDIAVGRLQIAQHAAAPPSWSTPSLGPSETYIIPWSRETSEKVFRRHHSSLQMAR